MKQKQIYIIEAWCEIDDRFKTLGFTAYESLEEANKEIELLKINFITSLAKEGYSDEQILKLNKPDYRVVPFVIQYLKERKLPEKEIDVLNLDELFSEENLARALFILTGK